MCPACREGPAPRDGDVPVHRHRGLDAAAARARAGRVRRRARGAPARAPRRLRRSRRRRGRYPGRRVLRRLSDRGRRRLRRARRHRRAERRPDPRPDRPAHRGRRPSRTRATSESTSTAAARIAALAHGGQVVVSPTTAALLDSRPLARSRAHRLKDFDGATRLFQLGGERVPAVRTPGSVDLPDPGDARSSAGSRSCSTRSRLVLERDPRVLTVVGPGGTGKTRFAIELARLLAEEADGGTVFVPLAPLRDPALVVPAARGGTRRRDGRRRVDRRRRSGKRTHVVLDNFEQLLPAAARRSRRSPRRRRRCDCS